MNRNSIIIISIILLASILRLYRLGDIPGALNPDETALGYTAYSLLTTARDEQGALLPLTFESFGDWKLIGYPLLSTISVAIFGLTEFSTRLLSAVSGIISVVLIYYIARMLFKNEKVSQLAALFASISPWSLFFSRIAFEGSVAITGVLAAVLMLLHYSDQKIKRSRYLFVAFGLFGLSLFFYHPFLIFIPVFVLLLLIFSDKIFTHISVSQTRYASVVFWLFCIIALFSVVLPGIDKLNTLTVFTDQNMLHKRVELYRTDASAHDPSFEKLIHNRYTAIPYQIGLNYIASISPEFLFDHGGDKSMYTLGNFGQLYLFDGLLLIAGIGVLLWKRQKVPVILCSLWLIAGFLPSSITTDAPSATRLFLTYPVFGMLEAYGAFHLLRFFWINKKIRFMAFVVIAVFIGNVLLYLEAYFVHINFQRALYIHYGYKQAVEITKNYPDYSVIMRGPENFPYVSFLFYEKYDPTEFRKTVEYYPSIKNGFKLVKSFGRYEFPQDIQIDTFNTRTIYIDFAVKNNIFDDNPGLVDFDIYAINLPSGEPLFNYAIIE